MNRIFTLVIVTTLIITGSSVFAQQLPRTPRPAQHSEVIQYSIERASEVPSYRGYRKSNVYVAPKPARAFGQRTYPTVKKQSSFALSPPAPRRTIEAAPKIYSSSRRVTRIAVPSPAIEIAVSTPDPIQPAETKIEAITIYSPAVQPKATVAAPVISSSSRHVTRSTVPTPVTTIAISSPVEQPQATEAAPVIPSSSRRITRIAVPSPTTEIAVSTPDPIEPAEAQSDVVKTGTPAASPNFKYRSPSDYGAEELQQSQWQPQPKQVQSEEAITVSSPDEDPWTIDLSDPFETVAPAVATDNKTAAIPSKAALLGSENESPFTSFIAETDRLSAVEIENTTEAVGPIAFATTGMTTKAEVQTAKVVRTSAGKETSHQKSAAEAWWVVPALLAMPLLPLLGWAMFGRERFEYQQYYECYQHHQFEVAPTTELPQQSNTPWQVQESTEDELNSPVASETDLQEIHCSDETSVADESETELLDEIHSINAIAFNSNSAARSTSNSRAK